MKYLRKFNENNEIGIEGDILNIARDEDIKIKTGFVNKGVLGGLTHTEVKYFLFQNDNQVDNKEFIRIINEIKDRLGSIGYEDHSAQMLFRNKHGEIFEWETDVLDITHEEFLSRVKSKYPSCNVWSVYLSRYELCMRLK